MDFRDYWPLAQLDPPYLWWELHGNPPTACAASSVVPELLWAWFTSLVFRSCLEHRRRRDF